MADGTTIGTSWQQLHERLVADLDHYRLRIHDSLDGLAEDEARRSMVPSKTTLLGLVKHLAYVEAFYFEHSVTGQALPDLGVATTPDRCFVLRRAETMELGASRLPRGVRPVPAAGGAAALRGGRDGAR